MKNTLLSAKEKSKIDLYELYERSVQTPEAHAEIFEAIFLEIHKIPALVLREDFCGTYRISQEWVRRQDYHWAYGLDLDPEPIAYAQKNHLKKLTPEQRKRLRVYRKNVIQETRPKADLCIACNFSVYAIKDWHQLIRYFREVYRTLHRPGLFLLEVSGGPGMIRKMRERRRFHKNHKLWYQYIWDQQTFDPMSNEGRYAIHFQMGNGKLWKDAFVYDWRMWSIPELRLAMKLAGFEDTCVYWDESDSDKANDGVYMRRKKGDNDDVWIVLVGGIKKKRAKRTH